VLAGAAVAGGHCELVLLMREGIAAWIDRRSTGSPAPAAAPTAPRDCPAGVLLAADDLHASLVRVLASMALSNKGEVRP
jgi:hypothetical protein